LTAAGNRLEYRRATHPDALRARKGAGKEAKLSYCDNVPMEKRNGLVADVETLQADGKGDSGRGITDGSLDSGRRSGDSRRR